VFERLAVEKVERMTNGSRFYLMVIQLILE
jgi:hypothetical protein